MIQYVPKRKESSENNHSIIQINKKSMTNQTKQPEPNKEDYDYITNKINPSLTQAYDEHQ